MNVRYLKPIVTEKTSNFTGLNKFSFYTDPNTNKIEIQQFIAKHFGVKAVKINSAVCKGKTKRRGVITGKRDDLKKVVVTFDRNLEIEKIKGLY